MKARMRGDNRDITPRPRSNGSERLGCRLLRACVGRLGEELWSELRANRAYEQYRTGRMKDGRRFSRPPDPYTPPATAAGVLSGCWLPDERTRALRRRLARRAHLVRQRTRCKNEVHAVLMRTSRAVRR